jgi:hypothetical protein
MTVLVFDSFNRTSTTTLGTTDGGTTPKTWVNQDTTGVWGTDSAHAYVVTDSSNRTVNVLDAGVSDCTVEADINWVTGSNIGLSFRNVDRDNMYDIGVSSAGLVLRKYVAGVATTLGTYAFTPVNNTIYHIAVTLSGNGISVSLDGTTRLTATDSFNATATKYGLRTPAPMSGAYQDNFSVSIPDPPPPIQPPFVKIDMSSDKGDSNNYVIYVRDANLNKVGQIDLYSKLDMALIFNDVGKWTLSGLDINSNAVAELLKEKAGIIVKRNGKTILSGPASLRNMKWDKTTNEITLSGVDDNVFLRRYLALPVPSGPPYTASDYDVRTGRAETIMKQYVTDNIGANATKDRKINIVNDTDLGMGNVVTARARFDQILQFFQGIANYGGNLGFNVKQVGTSLVFYVYQSKDLSRSVIFSPLLGNLLGFEYSDTDPEANYIIAGGQGEGTARVIIEQGDSDSISSYGRVEEFLDKRQTTDSGEITQAIIDELASKANKMSLSISPFDTDSIAYGKDYNLGDIVTVTLTKQNFDGSQSVLNTFSDVVRQINISVTKDGDQVTPTIGTNDSLANPVKHIFSKLSSIGKRVGNLERV